MKTLNALLAVVGLAMVAVAGSPATALAQDAVLTGTVTDTTGGVLPGVTITATNTATGNVFTAVTDAAGTYRVPVRVGVYRITSELSGFQTLAQDNVQILLGRQAVID